MLLQVPERVQRSSVMQRSTGRQNALARLARLAGRLCPVCRTRGRMRPLLFDGSRLRCQADHTYSNPDVAEEEILADQSRSTADLHKLWDLRQAETEVADGHLLARLERAVGDWLPPEARRE